MVWGSRSNEISPFRLINHGLVNLTYDFTKKASYARARFETRPLMFMLDFKLNRLDEEQKASVVFIAMSMLALSPVDSE